jgi:hypothetical protein
VSELHIEDAFAGGQADSGLRPKQQKKNMLQYQNMHGAVIVGKDYGRMIKPQNCTTG